MAAAPAHTFVVQVAVPYTRVLTDLTVGADWLGTPVTATLRDDGSSRFDLPADGVYVAVLQGEYARYLAVTLTAHDGTTGELLPLYEGIVVQKQAGSYVANWTVVDHGEVMALRASSALPGRGVALSDALPLVASYGWAALVLLYVVQLRTLRGAARAEG